VFVQVFPEPGEPGRSELIERDEPLADLVEGFTTQSVPVFTPEMLLRHEPDAAQHGEVLRHRGTGHGQRGRELPDRSITRGQRGDDLPPDRVCEGSEYVPHRRSPSGTHACTIGKNYLTSQGIVRPGQLAAGSAVP
jgi:hypothetical protein